MLKHVERTHRGGTSQTPLSSWGPLSTPREPATQAVTGGRDRPALILIPVMCCMLRWMLLGGRVGLGIVMCPLLRSASSLACLFLFSHVFTGHCALGRRAYFTLLSPAVGKAVCLDQCCSAFVLSHCRPVCSANLDRCNCNDKSLLSGCFAQQHRAVENAFCLDQCCSEPVLGRCRAVCRANLDRCDCSDTSPLSGCFAEQH